MPITAISRNFSGSPDIVFIQSTDDLTTITAPGYLIEQQENIEVFNKGTFTFQEDDFCLINYVDGEGFFNVNATEGNLTPSSPPSGLSNMLQSGYFFVGNASNVASGVPMSGDAALANTGGVVVTKTNGVAFAASATVNTTNADNITSGALDPQRLSASGVTSGSYTVNGESLFTVDSKGRVTSASNIIITDINGITSLNGLTDATQIFVTGSGGTDFEISSSSDAHTFSIPSASDTARGLVTTGAQTIAGIKTFTDDITVTLGKNIKDTTGAGIYFSPSSNSWEISNLTPVTDRKDVVGYGNGYFIAYSVDTGSTLISADNGVNWYVGGVLTHTGSSNYPFIVYTGTAFVAINDDSSGETSYSLNNGYSWNAGTTTTVNILGGAAADSDTGRIVITGNTGAILPSQFSIDNGVSWTNGGNIPGTLEDARPVVFGNNTYVTISLSSNDSAYTTDGGVNWTASSNLPFSGWKGLVFNGIVFVAIGTSHSAYSSDGITWTAGGTPPGSDIEIYAAGDGVVVGIARNNGGNDVIYSLDNGVTWTLGTSTPVVGGTLNNGISYGRGNFIVGSTGGATTNLISGTVFNRPRLLQRSGNTELITLEDVKNNIPIPGYAVLPAGLYSSGAVSDQSYGTFIVAATGFTVVGSPTYTGSYSLVGKTMKCVITAISTVTIAATAGTAYFTGMPVAPAYSDVCMGATSTFVSLGNGIVETDGKVYVPSITATGDTIIISFSYQIA